MASMSCEKLRIEVDAALRKGLITLVYCQPLSDPQSHVGSGEAGNALMDELDQLKRKVDQAVKIGKESGSYKAYRQNLD